MFVMSDPIEEDKELNELIASNPEAAEVHQNFQAEMEFKAKLQAIRKKEALTQKEIAQRSGLSQQAVSRAERVQGTTLETVIRYLSSMGYILGIEKV